jgi:hypothetical protein
LGIGKRALEAARLAAKLAPDARQRQRAGIACPDGVKGKATAKAAEQFRVSPRTVESARQVQRRGIPELVQLLEQGKISVSAAVKLASRNPHVQRAAVEQIAAGRSVTEALVAVGVQEFEPRSFDDKALTQAIGHVRKMLDARMHAYGLCDAYRQARVQLDLLERQVTRWRTERLNEPMPVIMDAYGRRAPNKVVPAFQTAEEIKILCDQLDAIDKQAEALTRLPGGDLIQPNYVGPRLKQARKALSDARPWEVCSSCSGNCCPSCSGRGWVPLPGWAPART